VPISGHAPSISVPNIQIILCCFQCNKNFKLNTERINKKIVITTLLCKECYNSKKSIINNQFCSICWCITNSKNQGHNLSDAIPHYYSAARCTICKDEICTDCHKNCKIKPNVYRKVCISCIANKIKYYQTTRNVQ
jgi:hypothetical protein